jgi:hypothetical protein
MVYYYAAVVFWQWGGEYYRNARNTAQNPTLHCYTNLYRQSLTAMRTMYKCGTANKSPTINYFILAT